MSNTADVEGVLAIAGALKINRVSQDLYQNLKHSHHHHRHLLASLLGAMESGTQEQRSLLMH